MGIQLDLERTSRPAFIPHNFRKLTAITVLEVKSSWTPFAVLRRRGVSREDPGQHQAEHLVSSQPSPDPAWVLPGYFGMECFGETEVCYGVKELCCTVEEFMFEYGLNLMLC